MLRLEWHTAEPDALGTRLARLGFSVRTGPRGPVATLAGAEVAINERRVASDEGSLTLGDTSDAAGTQRKLEREVGAGSVGDPIALPGGGGLRLIALGWATVELERAAREFAGLVFVPAADDLALGAQSLVGRAAHDGEHPLDVDPVLVLLEPATEGRIAARLARHGEGPAVLYVAGPGGPDATGAAWRGAGVGAGGRAPGPFGPSVLALGPRGGPEIVAVADGHPYPLSSSRG